MNNRFVRVFASLALLFGTMTLAPQAGLCQHATIKTDPTSKKMEIKAVTSQDLKAAIGYAMSNGDLDPKDGKELIDKITDIETLMDQFDFIREHERRMMSSVYSPFH